MPNQDSWLVNEFKLCNSLVQQAMGALHKNRIKRAEKLLQEAIKVVERLKLWQSNVPSGQCSCEIAVAIENLHKTMVERQNWFVQLRNSNCPAMQHSQ